jgi:hypothetical protein
LIYRRIRHDPLRHEYTDEALEPVTTDAPEVAPAVTRDSAVGRRSLPTPVAADEALTERLRAD